MSLPPGPSRIAVPDDPRDLPGTFCHRREVDVRFADTDAMGHVNNAVYLTYCESARITYRAPAFHGETITVETRAARLGRTSFTLEHRLTASVPGGPARLVAASESILVRYDYTADAPVAISPAHRAAIEAFEGRSLG